MWIGGYSFDVNKAMLFVEKHLKNFVLKKSIYIPFKGEHMDNVTNRMIIAPQVALLFLFKKGKDGMAKGQSSIEKVYSTSNWFFYKDFCFNNEVK